MCPVSTELLSTEVVVVKISDVLGGELLMLGECEVVDASGESVFWENVSV